MIGHYWYEFRLWLASFIFGHNILLEIDAAYEAGREWGKVERFMRADEQPTV